MTQPHDEHDFIILGSGAAGLSAGLAALDRGLKPLILEKADTVGGTTAVSGGVSWVPCNHHQAQHGIEDCRESAAAYIKHLARGRSDDALIDAYLDYGPQMIRALEQYVEHDFVLIPDYPDYQAEQYGGVAGGRALDNALFQTKRLGESRPLLRTNPITGRIPITITEAMKWGVFSNPFNVPMKEVSARYNEGWVHGGAALVGRMYNAILKRGGSVQTEQRATSLIVEDRRVVGVRVSTGAGERELRSRRGVMLGTGGFEWDKELCAAFLPGVPAHPATPPSCEGDGLRMAMAVGANLGNMNQAWWCPAVTIPGEKYDGMQLGRSEFSIRCLPHSIIVNAQGRRFVNEALNYNDVGKPFWDFDPTNYRSRNQPAWVIVDGQFLDTYVFLTALPGREIPQYIASAETLEALADKLGIDSDGLATEVARFNKFAANGVDEDFGRGEGAFERFYGDPGHAGPNPNLGTLEKGPFAALPVHGGTIGTKGGPRTDAYARVLNTSNEPIPGLYAAGNAAASPMGEGYPGPGATICSALTFGWLGARHAADS